MFIKSVLSHTQVQSHSVCIPGKYECTNLSRHDLRVKDPSVRSTRYFTELAVGSRKCNFFLFYQIIYLKSKLKCNLHVQWLEYIYSMIGTFCYFISVIKWIYLFCWGDFFTLIKSCGATMQKHAGEKHKTGNYIIEGTPADPQHCVSRSISLLNIRWFDLCIARQG